MRVEQLAAAAAVSVDTVRYYQSRALLPPPQREGRVAWYGAAHLQRLARIRDLADRGLSLATIGRLLSGELDSADEALAAAVSSSLSGASSPVAPVFDLDELARRTGIPLPLLQAVVREGLLVARRVDGTEVFSDEDVAVAAAGLRLLELGLPLPELMDLARQHDAAMRSVAERAVTLFDTHIRHPLRSSSLTPEAAAEQLVSAFQDLLPATVAIVTHHFQRTLLAVALEHIERVGDGSELAAVRRVSAVAGVTAAAGVTAVADVPVVADVTAVGGGV